MPFASPRAHAWINPSAIPLSVVSTPSPTISPCVRSSSGVSLIAAPVFGLSILRPIFSPTAVKDVRWIAWLIAVDVARERKEARMPRVFAKWAVGMEFQDIIANL